VDLTVEGHVARLPLAPVTAGDEAELSLDVAVDRDAFEAVDGDLPDAVEIALAVAADLRLGSAHRRVSAGKPCANTGSWRPAPVAGASRGAGCSSRTTAISRQPRNFGQRTHSFHTLWGSVALSTTRKPSRPKKPGR